MSRSQEALLFENVIHWKPFLKSPVAKLIRNIKEVHHLNIDLLTHQLNVHLSRVKFLICVLTLLYIFYIIMLCMFIYVLCIACARTLAKIYIESAPVAGK